MKSEMAEAVPAAQADPWRESVRKGMLTVAAFIAPPVVLLGLFLRTGPSTWLDDVMLLGTGIVLPILRFVPGSLAARSLALLAVACTTSIYLLARFGLVAGISVSLTTFSVLALISASRRIGFTIIALTAVAYFTFGLLASHHLLDITAADTDPYRLRNWIRMGTNSCLLAILLMSVIDFVIRHVEANARAATHAMARLQEAATARARHEQHLELAYERLGQLHRALETTKEEERRALSRELHDELGQTLTVLKLRLQLGARGAQPVPELSGSTEPLALVDDLIARVRKISVDLRPPLLDEVGLVSALRVYIENQAAVSGLAIDLQADEPAGAAADRLPPDYEIACFRVVQESITNALRHAAARHLRVSIKRSRNGVRLSIRDDGRGFDPDTLDAAATRGHLGILGMRERIRARGGEFSLTSRPGAGTSIEVELSAPPRVAASG
jgi:signal transduction histidine kinase